MPEESPSELQQLVNAIKQNTTWTGQSVRELKDKVEEAAKQTAKLAQTVESSARALQEEVAASRVSGARQRRALCWAGVILALAIIVQVIVALIHPTR